MSKLIHKYYIIYVKKFNNIKQDNMYKNKNGALNNIAGIKIATFRKNRRPKMSQRALADKMQLVGIDIDKNAIQRIECGKRFITDIELKAISDVLKVDVNELLN
jgi:hypothetical protein